LTDGRFSGATRGPMVGHVAPEAAVGGPIAALEDGDTVRVDVPERTLAVELSDAEIERRLADHEPPAHGHDAGVMAKYGRSFGSAADGAVTNPAARQD